MVQIFLVCSLDYPIFGQRLAELRYITLRVASCIVWKLQSGDCVDGFGGVVFNESLSLNRKELLFRLRFFFSGRAWKMQRLLSRSPSQLSALRNRVVNVIHRRINSTIRSASVVHPRGAVPKSPGTNAVTTARITLVPLYRTAANDSLLRELGLALPPPETGIWINGTYRWGPVIHFVRLLLKPLGWNVGDATKAKTEREIKYLFIKNKFAVRRIISRFKEQGMYVYFGGHDEAHKALEYIRAAGKKFADTFLVEGEPFIEDLLDVRPTPKLRVTSTKPEIINTEALFKQFRKYGKIRSVVVENNVAHITFMSKRSAIRYA